jgi:hypothetical protein
MDQHNENLCDVIQNERFLLADEESIEKFRERTPPPRGLTLELQADRRNPLFDSKGIATAQRCNCPCPSGSPALMKSPEAMPRGSSAQGTVAVDQLAQPVEAVVEADSDHMDLLLEIDSP